MKVFERIVDLKNELFYLRKQGKTIGLVPTMGALHDGHASLIRRSAQQNDVTVVSVFLNPTQFNDKNDLERYPRTLDAEDWQQIAVVKRLVDFINVDVDIVECPIVRDEDGLAKSSRNTLLSADERAIAPYIYKVLKASTNEVEKLSVQELRSKVIADINAVDGLEVEYFDIVDGNTLLPVKSWDDTPYIVGCITVYCGKTPIRLIDHIKYKG